MNKLFKRLILALLLVNAALWSIPSHALLITGSITDVGSIDTYLDQTTDPLDNSSPYTETEWVNTTLLTTGITWTVVDANVPYFSVEAGPNDNVFAFSLIFDPVEGPADYFLIKNSTHTALYQNLDNIYWGVFDADSLDAGFNIGGSDFTISHVTQLIGGDRGIEQPVPEPTISALLGIGLLGMIGVSRRRKV